MQTSTERLDSTVSRRPPAGRRRPTDHLPRLVRRAVLAALEADLGRRFGNDTRIIGADGPAAGLARLAALAERAEPVALLIADQRMPEMTGIEFLDERARAASAGEADPARRARLHDGESDRARR